MKKLTMLAVIMGIITAVFSAKPALAVVPVLQLYIEGAVYDTLTETWVTPASDFNLQVIGANYAIKDVYLALAVPTGETGTITINSIPVGPFTFGNPVMSDGRILPNHGIYPTDFTTYFIGDFGLLYPVFDMQPGGDPVSVLGEIKTFAVSITGYSDVHFDAYDHVLGKSRAKFSPKTHDAEHSDVIPEPTSLLLMGSGLLGMATFLRKKKT